MSFVPEAVVMSMCAPLVEPCCASSSCVCDTAAHFGLATQTGIDPNTLFEFRLQEKLILLIANINYFDFGFCDM
jgi:hypothetical protein